MPVLGPSHNEAEAAPQFAHDFRGRPSACTGCDRLKAGMPGRQRSEPCDGPRWAWTVTGTMTNVGGNIVHDFRESGILVAPGYGDALVNLISWSDAPLDCLDGDEEFTITMRRLDYE